LISSSAGAVFRLTHGLLPFGCGPEARFIRVADSPAELLLVQFSAGLQDVIASVVITTDRITSRMCKSSLRQVVS
jgi:hypothetical protein